MELEMDDDTKKELNEKISGLFFINNIVSATEELEEQQNLTTTNIIKKSDQNYINYFKNICKLLCIYNETNKFGIISKNSFENAKIERFKFEIDKIELARDYFEDKIENEFKKLGESISECNNKINNSDKSNSYADNHLSKYFRKDKIYKMEGKVLSGRITIQDEKKFKIIFEDNNKKEVDVDVTLKIKSFEKISDKPAQIKYDIINGENVYIYYEVIDYENLSKLNNLSKPKFLLDVNNDKYPLNKEMIDYPIIKYEIFEKLYNNFSNYSKLLKSKILSHLDQILLKGVYNQKFFNAKLLTQIGEEKKFIKFHYELYEKQLKTKEDKIEEINKKIVLLKEYQADPIYKKQRTKLKSYYSALISGLNMLEGETKDKREKLETEKKSLETKIEEINEFLNDIKIKSIDTFNKYDEFKKKIENIINLSLNKIQKLIDLEILNRESLDLLLNVEPDDLLLDQYNNFKNFYKNSYDYNLGPSINNYNLRTATAKIKILDLDLLYLIYSNKTALLFFNMIQNKLFALEYKSDKRIYMTEPLYYGKPENKNRTRAREIYGKNKDNLHKFFLKEVLKERRKERYGEEFGSKNNSKDSKYISDILSILPSHRKVKDQKYFKYIEYLREKYMLQNEETVYSIRNPFETKYKDIDTDLIPLVRGRLTIEKLKKIFLTPLEKILNERSITYAANNNTKKIKRLQIEFEVMNMRKFIKDTGEENNLLKLFTSTKKIDKGEIENNELERKAYLYLLLQKIKEIGKEPPEIKVTEFSPKKEIFEDLHKASSKHGIFIT